MLTSRKVDVDQFEELENVFEEPLLSDSEEWFDIDSDSTRIPNSQPVPSQVPTSFFGLEKQQLPQLQLLAQVQSATKASETADQLVTTQLQTEIEGVKRSQRIRKGVSNRERYLEQD